MSAKPIPYTTVPASPADRRRWALGPQLWDWCDKVEPKLRGEVEAGMEDTAKLSMMARQAIDALTVMHLETPADVEAAANALDRLTELRERNAAIHEREVRMFNQLSAGGAASYWAAMQRGASKQQAESRDERTVKPRRRFRLVEAESAVHSAASDIPQAVEAEVVAEDGD